MIRKTIFLYSAWLLSSILTLGSLYLSQILHYEPCVLCWYQRIFLFPLPIILGVALYKGFFQILPFVIAFPCLGVCFSSYQILLPLFPSLQKISTCSMQELSCFESNLYFLGIFSPAMINCLASALLVVCLILSYQKKTEDPAIS